MGITLIKNKNHNVIKRNGKIEPFSQQKLEKVLRWAIGKAFEEERIIKSEFIISKMIEEVLNDINIKIYDKIKIERLFSEVIATVANKISPLQPIWNNVAKNLLIQQYYKEVWNIKRDEYPDYLDLIKKALQYKVYNKDVIDTFTEEELKELGDYIKPERDFKFTFGGFDLFMRKYSRKYTKTKYLELPQHIYMRAAIQLHYKDKNRIERIKEKYDIFSNHLLAPATPILLNALADVFNPTSCVLIEVADDSESIMEVARSMSIYSKNASGLGIDISNVRGKGSLIGKDGVSSGTVPFVKIYESVVSAFNQKSARVGAAIVYFPIWHIDVENLIMLKDAGGNDEVRARKLKYGLKWYKYFTKKLYQKDDTIYLFDPKDTPKLLTTYGEEFAKWYEYYCGRTDIRKKKVSLRDLVFSFAKVRAETGNLYWLSMDNVNEYRASRDVIKQSNLCTEVLLPTKPVRVVKNTLQKDLDTNEIKEVRELKGEIGICNLTSINLLKWWELSEEEKDKLAYSLLLGIDNSIEYGSYPVKAGETFNKTHRAIGVGVTNYHAFLVHNKVKFTDEKARELTHNIMEDVYYYIIKNSIRLSKERGRYDVFKGSLWDKGILPFELYEKHFEKLENKYNKKFNYSYIHDWTQIKKDIKQYGVRFEFHLAIPPTATSGLVLNFTEGIEPIKQIFQVKEGTYNLPFLVPELKNRQYYEYAWDIPSEIILDLAAIRQKFLDQTQSLNLYRKEVKSALNDIIVDVLYAEELGVKTLYYFNSLKKGEIEEQCESCAV